MVLTDSGSGEYRRFYSAGIRVGKRCFAFGYLRGARGIVEWRVFGLRECPTSVLLEIAPGDPSPATKNPGSLAMPVKSLATAPKNLAPSLRSG